MANITELKVLAAVLAGARLTARADLRVNAARPLVYTLKVVEQDLTGEDIQEICSKLLKKHLIRFSASMGLVTETGREALATLNADPADYFYEVEDLDQMIYVGTVFVCRICNDFGSKDKDSVYAHIETDHGDDNNHNDPDDEDDDGDPSPAMDRPYNFDEPITDGGPQKADLSYYNRPITDGGPQSL